MKKLFVLLLLGMFMISFASSMEIDNWVNYENNDMKVRITNALNLGKDLGTAELKSHKSVNEILEVAPGKDVVTMYYDINFKKIYKNGLGEVEFIDMNTGEYIEKDYHFVYWGTTSEEKNKYKQVCKEIGGDITMSNACERVFEGTYIEEKEGWINLDTQDIPKGMIRIGLATDVNLGDTVDGIWTIAGKKIKKHAVWTSELYVNLEIYYKLDETSGDIIDSTGNNDATNYGATTNVAGKIGTAYDFDQGNGDFINSTSNISITGSSSFSINNWFYMNSEPSAAQYDTLTALGPAIAGECYALLVDLDTANAFYVSDYGGGLDAEVTTTKTFLNQWHMATSIYNGTTLMVYIDGENIYNRTHALAITGAPFYSGKFAGESFYLDGKVDEIGLWSRELTTDEVAQLYNEGTGISYTTPNINITLNSPEDNFESNISTTTFNVSVNATNLEVVNLSLLIDGIISETNTSGIIGEYIFEKDLTFGEHNWSIRVTDNQSNITNSENRTVILDINFPTITVENPTGTLDYNYVGGNETLNVTFIDTNLDSCWYNYNGTNITIEGCLTGVENSTNFTLESENTNMTIYANDSFGNINSTFIEWNYKFIENSQTYSNLTTVGAIENFILNGTIGSGYDITTASLIYGNDTLSPSISSYGDNRIISVSNYEISFYSEDTNISFHWSILLDDSTIINTSSRIMLVSPVLLDNCSTYTNYILNISLFDEETKSPISGNVELAYSLLNSETYSTINTIYYEAIGVNSTLVCSEVNISGENLVYSAEIRYESTDHVSELYNIQRSAITEGLQSINLYDLKDNDSTVFKIIYQDSTFNFVEEAIIQLQRKYISEGIYETVEAPLTSSDGVSLVHINLDAIKYRATVVKNGIVLDEFDNLVFKCQSELTGECEQKLLGTINPENDIDFDTARDFSYSINKVEDVITLSFIIPSGAPSSVNIELTQKDQFGSSEVCNNTILSSAGSVECTISETLGDSYIDLIINKNGYPMAISSYVVAEDGELNWVGNNYIFIVILLFSLMGMALSSPEWIIINGIITMVISGALYLASGLDFVMGLGNIVWLVIAAIILIAKISKQEDR